MGIFDIKNRNKIRFFSRFHKHSANKAYGIITPGCLTDSNRVSFIFTLAGLRKLRLNVYFAKKGHTIKPFMQKSDYSELS